MLPRMARHTRHMNEHLRGFEVQYETKVRSFRPKLRWAMSGYILLWKEDVHKYNPGSLVALDFTGLYRA
jgi:hypothetical protein